MNTKLIRTLVLTSCVSMAPAATIDLFEWAVNIDGTVSTPPVAGVDAGGFDTSTGLGTVTITTTGAGAHYSALFVDHEIDQTINTFFNEVGGTSGSAAAGQSWEIDEPGFSTGPILGDIYDNFLDGTLDNSNGVPGSPADDVSMALGWDFSLTADEIAVATFQVSETAPTTGFFLTHTDPDSPASIYFSSSLRITDDGQGGTGPNDPPGVPESGLTLTLMLISLIGLGSIKRRFARSEPKNSQ